jgi:hypothetical protein
MAETPARASRRVSAVFLLLGIALIILSWTPIGRLATEANWTSEDSVRYSRLVEENHRAIYESPGRTGFTEAELADMRQRIQQDLAAKIRKLDYAKSRPEAWSRILFWLGAALAGLGVLALAIGPSRRTNQA